jgi:hypothetical protein
MPNHRRRLAGGSSSPPTTIGRKGPARSVGQTNRSTLHLADALVTAADPIPRPNDALLASQTASPGAAVCSALKPSRSGDGRLLARERWRRLSRPNRPAPIRRLCVDRVRRLAAEAPRGDSRGDAVRCGPGHASARHSVPTFGVSMAPLGQGHRELKRTRVSRAPSWDLSDRFVGEVKRVASGRVAGMSHA